MTSVANYASLQDSGEDHDTSAVVSDQLRKTLPIKYFTEEREIDSNWNSVTIVLAPFQFLDSTLRYSQHIEAYACAQNVPLITCLIIALCTFRFCHQITILIPLLLVLFTVVICPFCLCMSTYRFCKGTFSNCMITILACLQFVLTFFLLLVDPDSPSPNVGWFRLGFLLCSAVSYPGMGLVCIGLIAICFPIEFVIRVLICRLRSCSITQRWRSLMLKRCELRIRRLDRSSDSMCSVCLQEMLPEQEVVTMECGGRHVVHLECLLHRADRELTCPVCAQPTARSWGDVVLSVRRCR